MAVEFNPYYRWLSIPLEEQPPDHYRLLGVKRFETDPLVIEHAADRQMDHLRRMNIGPHGALAEKLLSEVATASACLLVAEKKSAYDAKLRAKHSASSLAPTNKDQAGAPQPVRKAVPVARPLPASTAVPTPDITVPQPTVNYQGSGKKIPRRKKSSWPLLAAAGGIVVVVGGLIAFLASGTGREVADRKGPKRPTTMPKEVVAPTDALPVAPLPTKAPETSAPPQVAPLVESPVPNESERPEVPAVTPTVSPPKTVEPPPNTSVPEPQTPSADSSASVPPQPSVAGKPTLDAGTIRSIGIPNMYAESLTRRQVLTTAATAVLAGTTSAEGQDKPTDKPVDLGKAYLRVARPSDDLEPVVKFYRDGLGFEILGQFKDSHGFDEVIMALKGAAYQLEFTRKAGHKVGRAPSEDNLLVFYIANVADWEKAVARFEKAGYNSVKSFNPFWDGKGKTFEDPDGYRIVLQNSNR